MVFDTKASNNNSIHIYIYIRCKTHLIVIKKRVIKIFHV
jgi:hypothetical protein